MGKRREQRTRIAIPVRIYTRDAQKRSLMESACTMDVTPRGARLTGVRGAHQVGDVLCLERGKNKAFYRVMWIGDRSNRLEGQMGLQCIEPDAAIWGVDLISGEDERYDSPKKSSSAALLPAERKNG